jgi:hypothetical protein
MQLANEGQAADLLLGNNVLAHVPDINDFVGGMKILLNPNGLITMEFPHLMHLIEFNQFDTIYHEHFSYISLATATRIFESHGLKIFDVDEIPTHGGSLRIYAKHDACTMHSETSRVSGLLAKERAFGLENIDFYKNFTSKVKQVKYSLLEALINIKRQEKSIAAYGAAAKGNTLLNYCGIRTDFIDYVVDKNPEKQDRYLPGSHIPIYSPEKIVSTRPDYLLILPWNIKEEIIQQMSVIREWGGQFIVPIPEVQVIP